MRVRDENVIEHQGNLQPIARRRMNIDLDNIAHIIRPLTDLYSDKELACIREYSTNAFDAHVAAGITDPIEIELPTQLRPVFVVRDHGLGLSYEEILDHYGTYGWSSKRDTDEAVGMLGFGCKAALTYTNQFTVSAVKNHVRTQVLITRDTDGVGEIQVLDTASTSEPNGVEIQIPVKAPIDSFTRKALAFYRFWTPGMVLVDATQPPSYWDGENNDNLFLDDDIIVVKRGYNAGTLDRDYVVMGNVPYPCDLNTGMGAKVVARVAIGEVSFTPSRESLQMDERTKEVCETVREFVHERLHAHIRRQIEQQPDHKSVIEECQRWDGLVRNWQNKKPEWRGERIPMQLEVTGQTWSASYVRNTANATSYVRCEDLIRENWYVLVHHPPRSMSKETKTAIQQAYPRAAKVVVVHAVRNRAHREWLMALAKTIDFNDIKPVAAPGVRATNSKYRQGGGRWLTWERANLFRTEDLPVDDEVLVVYALKSDCGASGQTRDKFRENLGEFLTTEQRTRRFKFVLLGKEQELRFKTLHPDALYYPEYFAKRTAELFESMTDDQFWWGEQSDWRTKLKDHDLLDPEMVKFVKRLVAASSEKPTWTKLKVTYIRGRQITGHYPTIPGHASGQDLDEIRRSTKTDLSKERERFTKEYPLTNEFDLDATVEYINAIYLYRKGDCQ